MTILHPWIVAFAFGLLHGFGFASGLSALGLPSVGIPLALVMFNVGGRDRPGLVRVIDLDPRTLFSPIGNPLASLGPGIAGLYRGIARRVLDDSASGNAFGNYLVKVSNLLP